MNLVSTNRGHEQNGFDALRILAASLVIFGHGFLFSGLRDPGLDITGYAPSTTLAVFVFFVISGYLVAESWDRQPHVMAYLAKRGLRILPALGVIVVISALLVGPWLTRLSLGQYFGDWHTWWYIPSNLLLYPQEHTLPGLFQGNLEHDVVGTLWTLPVEFSMYLALAAIAIVGRRRWASLGALTVLIALAFTFSFPFVPEVPGTFGLYHSVTAAFAIYFFSGTLLYSLRERLRWSTSVAVLALVAYGLSWQTAAAPFVGFLTIPYCVIHIGRSSTKTVLPLLVLGDISYGLYLYGYLVQQIASTLMGGKPSPASLFLTSFPIAVVLAAVSWRFVEKPALGLKRRLSPSPFEIPSAPAGQATPERTSGVSSQELVSAGKEPSRRPSHGLDDLTPVAEDEAWKEAEKLRKAPDLI